eukprot:5952275-Pleurochrysis_carterae.AAC.1
MYCPSRNPLVPKTVGITGVPASPGVCGAFSGPLPHKTFKCASSQLCRAQLLRASFSLTWSCSLCPSLDVQGIDSSTLPCSGIPHTEAYSPLFSCPSYSLFLVCASRES